MHPSLRYAKHQRELLPRTIVDSTNTRILFPPSSTLLNVAPTDPKLVIFEILF